MILLTKLNGAEITVNANQIESVEQCPDTRVALMNGKQIYVRETPEQICDASRAWLRSYHGQWHGGCDKSGGTPENEAMTNPDSESCRNTEAS